MPLNIKDKNQTKLSVKKTQNNLTQQLAEMPNPPPTYSGFKMIIPGSTGPEKTTKLYPPMLP